MHRYPHLNLIALLLLSTSSLAAVPGPGRWPAANNSWLLKVQNKDIGVKAAARVVRQATGGRILAVKRTHSSSTGAYKVKVLLKGGRVRVLHVDAASGALR